MQWRTVTAILAGVLGLFGLSRHAHHLTARLAFQTPAAAQYLPTVAGNVTANKGILLTLMVGGTLPFAFKDCAVVGSASSMLGSGKGPAIDAHDTVIRVNRVPTEEFWSDFGQRTDILFTSAMSDERPAFIKTGQRYTKLGRGGKALCPFVSDSSLEPCPFKSLVLKDADEKTRWEKLYPENSAGWLPNASQFPIARESRIAGSFIWQLVDGKRPTTGFHAFLLFTALCDRLSLYGFSGKSTADGHPIKERFHNVTREHEIIAQVAAGTFKLNGMHDPHWMSEELAAKAGKITLF
jgi:hypothetical protein